MSRADKPTLYQLLDLQPSADAPAIKAAFRRLARQYHPDTQNAAENAEGVERFREINRAYEVLSNPDQRAKYDAWLLREAVTHPDSATWREVARALREKQPTTPSDHKLTITVMFAVFGFVCLAMIGMTIILVEYTPRPNTAGVQTAQAEQKRRNTSLTQTAIIGQTLPTPDGIEFDQRAISAADLGRHHPDRLPLACEIDLEANTHTCADIPQIQFRQDPAAGRTALTITLNPDRSVYTRALFEITYGDVVEGWTVHLSDAAQNDGLGGDDDHQLNTAELSIEDSILRLYGSAAYDPPATPLTMQDEVVAPNQTFKIEVGHQVMRWATADGAAQEVESRYLFALRGERDYDSSGRLVPNYAIYAAFNRLVDNTSNRTGRGVTHVRITLLAD